ncbi:hypothetical protein [Uliginosibacterium gangwonense]|uniref:hypothetical protein n=1 Tax=Uliginosibacterium gangwonense TaxID=392736 RepID=UPI0012F7E0E1|nr:hypothetical protein [Uliginosibacterium gangwonense]
MSNTIITSPQDKFLRFAGSWISIYLVFVLFEASGLWQLGIIPSGYKAVLAGLSGGGGVALTYSLLSWYEQKVSCLSALRRGVINRIVRAALVVLCIALLITGFLVHLDASNIKSHCAALDRADKVLSSHTLQASLT